MSLPPDKKPPKLSRVELDIEVSPSHILLFNSLKKEPVHLKTLHSRAQAKNYVFDYIEIFYNRQRRHSVLNHKTPLEHYLENKA